MIFGTKVVTNFLELSPFRPFPHSNAYVQMKLFAKSRSCVPSPQILRQGKTRKLAMFFLCAKLPMKFLAEFRSGDAPSPLEK